MTKPAFWSKLKSLYWKRVDKVISLKDILDNRSMGRESPQAITYSERGNMQGAQFHAVAGRVYEIARERGIGREIPTGGPCRIFGTNSLPNLLSWARCTP